MEKMILTICKVERNSFTDDKGIEIKYCKIYFLTPVKDNENNVGYDVKGYSTKYDNYDKLVNLYKSGKPVDVEFDIVEFRDVLKRKLKKINDIEL